MKPTLTFYFLCTTLAAILLSHALSRDSYSQSPLDSIEYSVNYLLSTFDLESEQADQAAASSIELLLSYFYNPINLNTCSYNELSALPLLDESIAKQIIKLRDDLGALNSFSDLLIINSISQQLILAIKPFVVISSPIKRMDAKARTVTRPNSNSRTTLITQSIYRQIEKPAGYSIPPTEGGFQGSPTSLYTRIASESARGISIRLSLEKDPGESIAWAPRKNIYGADHLEMAVSISSTSFLRQLILGHYTVKFGQGLLFSSLFTSHKGTDPSRILLNHSSNIRPSSSRSEGKSFRGVAAHAKLTPSINIFGLLSIRNKDASLIHHEDSSQLGITSILTNGLHRTDSEIQRKGRLKEILGGLSLAYNRGSTSLGLTTYSTRFNYPFLKKNLASSTIPEFTGHFIKGWSFWGKVHSNNTEITWEVARSNPGSYAFLSSVIFRPSTPISVIVLFRDYSSRFFSFYGKSFGEQSTNRNETGFYTGSRIELSDGLTGFLFFDLYEIAERLPGGFQKPISGIEGFAKLSYAPRSWLTGFIEYRVESKPARTSHYTSDVHILHSSTTHTRQVCKLRLEYDHSKTLKLKTHVETRFGNLLGEKSRGVLLYQDITVYPTQRTKLHLRFSIFDSNRNDTILYAFENDLRYKFGIRSYSGQGVRNLLLLRHYISNEVILEFKYANTHYPRKTPKGTGVNATMTSRIREISGQISLRI